MLGENIAREHVDLPFLCILEKLPIDSPLGRELLGHLVISTDVHDQMVFGLVYHQ